MKPSRRRFLETGALAGAALGLGRTGFGEPRVAAAQAPPAPSWIDKPMRWAQLTLVEDDPVSFDVGFWLDYFRRTHSDAVCLSAGGCVAYYPTRGAVPSPQRLARRAGRLRRARRGLPQAGDGRRRAHGPPRHLRRRAGRASRLDRGRRLRQAAPPLGLARDVGDLRARPLQLRVHDGGHEGDRLALQGRRHLHQPLDGLRHVLLPALRPELPRRYRQGAAPARDARSLDRRARLPALAPAARLRPLAALGRRDAQDQPRRLRHPQHRRRRHQPRST